MSGECQTKNVNNYDKEDEEKPIIALDEGSSSFLLSSRTICHHNNYRSKLISIPLIR